MLETEIVRSADRLAHVANEIAPAAVIGLDLETTSGSPLDGGKVRLMSLNTGSKVYVIDLFETGTLGPVQTAIAESSCIKILQNAKFDQKWLLHQFGLELTHVFDTFRASALINNGRDMPNDLYSLYERELKVKPSTKDLGGSNWGESLSDEQYQYSAEDAQYLLALRESLRPKLIKQGLVKVAQIEFQVVLPEASTELNGFYLDPDAWMAVSKEVEIEMLRLRRELVHELPSPSSQMTLPGMDPSFNLDSPKQVLESFRKLGVDTDTTREMAMAMFAAKYPIVRKFLDYRKASKKLNSFGPEYLRHIKKATGRIHAEYYPFTGAGRYACSGPNIQQIPRDKRYRNCFRAAPGCILVGADYSGIEMRIVAEIANDRKLIAVFREGKDVHRRTAAIINEIAEEAVDKDKRQKAKPVNFGFIYGMQPPKLILYAQANYNVSLSLDESTKYRKRYFEEYSGIGSWHERALNEGKRSKMAKTIGGRTRYLENEQAHNEFFNTPVQGTGADALKSALRNVFERLRKYDGKVKIVHHVHDEIITECPNDPEVVAAVKKDLSEGMTEAMSQFLKKVPIEVEPSSGETWATCKG